MDINIFMYKWTTFKTIKTKLISKISNSRSFTTRLKVVKD